MNTQIKKLATKAGFIFWGNENWGPGPGSIVWSTNYDKEMEKFLKLVAKECSSLVEDKETKDTIKRHLTGK